MSWTYDPGLLQDDEYGPLMRVRFALGDTNAAGPLLQDEEVQFLLDTHPTEGMATAVAADRIAANYAHEATYSVGNLRIDSQQRATNFRELAKQFRSEGGAGYPTALKSARPYSEFPQANAGV